MSNGKDIKKDDGREIANMKKMMLETKVDGKKSVWAATLETFGMADGKNKKHDQFVDSVEEGLQLLNDYVSKLDSTCMKLVPLTEFRATQDDFLRAFVKWAERDEDDTNEGKGRINISKAHRRLDAYFEWMNDNSAHLEEPLTVESILPAAKIWDVQVTYNQGRFVWWIDLGTMDKEAIQQLSSTEHLRWVVWFAHLVMFDKHAQDEGAMIIEDLGYIGFWKLATLVPTELGAKMDRLTIGIVPVKMKAIYVFGAARWMTLLMILMKPFMGKKMRKRMILVPKSTDMQAFCDELVTRQNIPMGFCGLKGEAERDTHYDSLAK